MSKQHSPEKHSPKKHSPKKHHPKKHEPSGLQAKKLCCERGYRELFKDLSFTLLPGEIIHIKGENGTGKTSLLRILAGLAQPVSGEITFDDYDTRKYRYGYNAEIAYIGHKPGIKLELTPVENIRSYCNLSRSKSDVEIIHVLEKVGLYGFEEMFCSQLSAGQKRRVALAQAIIDNASLWILDEPFTSLDVVGVKYFEQMIQQHVGKGGMVLLTTHQDVSLEKCKIKYLHLPSGNLDSN
jgi:heme exporter protein A